MIDLENIRAYQARIDELTKAIQTLIKERDMAIKDANHLLGNECNRYFCANGEDCNAECRWRGVRR